MNWMPYQVSEQAFARLVDKDEPIAVAEGILPANCGVELFTAYGGKHDAFYDAKRGVIRNLKTHNPQFDSMPNRDLALFNDFLMSKHINTIIVDGFFGTGKTATVCSHLVHRLTQGLYGKEGGIPVAYLAKPHQPLGRSYGHLPGTLDEKTEPEFKSYFQYFDRFGQPYLLDKLMLKDSNRQKQFSQMLYVTTFEYIRGVDIERGWVILDEAQNTNTAEMSALLSRAGDDAKLIILGDSSFTQIDRQGNSPDSNGLNFAKKTYAGKPYAGVVEMQTLSHILRGQRVRDLFTSLKG